MNVNPVGWPGSAWRVVARVFSTGVNAARPAAAVSVEDAMGRAAPITAPDADLVLLARGTGAMLAQVPDGTIESGNKRGIYAVDWQRIRTLSSTVASGSYSVVAGGSGNRAQSSYAAVGGGVGNLADAGYSYIGGGNSNSATGLYSFVGGGTANSATGLVSSVLGGGVHNANGAYSAILGGYLGNTRSISGYCVIPACQDPMSTGTGGTIQSARLLMGRQTTNDTATVLTSTTSAAATTNQVVLPNNSAYSFSGEVIATITGGGDTARWTINGAIKRGANAASTTLVGTPTVTMTHNDAGAAAWVAAVTANTTLGCLTVTVTGAAATTIRWVAKIDTTEVTF
ncbi:MAG: hypothetical protein ACO242_02675 [Candidatus Fonsibacter ubiquis]